MKLKNKVFIKINIISYNKIYVLYKKKNNIFNNTLNINLLIIFIAFLPESRNYLLNIKFL
jgi:hypothetical protein